MVMFIIHIIKVGDKYENSVNWNYKMIPSNKSLITVNVDSDVNRPSLLNSYNTTESQYEVNRE